MGLGAPEVGFLPYAHTDFIFAIIGEELGLVGACSSWGCSWCSARSASAPRCRARPVRHAGLRGVTVWFVVQAFVNIGAVIGMLPITGVPLPFVSFGGSSLLVTMAAPGCSSTWPATRPDGPRRRDQPTT